MRAKTLEVESDRIIMIDNESCSLGKGKVRYASDSFSGHKTASLMRIYTGTYSLTIAQIWEGVNAHRTD